MARKPPRYTGKPVQQRPDSRFHGEAKKDFERFPVQSSGKSIHRYTKTFRTPTEGYRWVSGRTNKKGIWTKGHWRSNPGQHPKYANMTRREKTKRFGSGRAGRAEYHQPVWRQHTYFREHWNKTHKSFIKVDQRSINNVVAKLAWMGNLYTEGAYEGFMEAGLYILEKASETIPWDTGFLNSTGFFKVGWKQGVQVGYHASYAEAQHEKAGQRRNGRRGKWLELTLKEQQGKISQIIYEHTARRT